MRRTVGLIVAATLVAACSSAVQDAAPGAVPSASSIAPTSTDSTSTSIASTVTSEVTTTSAALTTAPEATTPTVPVVAAPDSRRWMLFAQEIVKARKPSPPASARLYAYVAGAYWDVLEETQRDDEASLAVVRVLSAILPDDAGAVAVAGNTIGVAKSLSDSAAKIVDSLIERAKTDGAAAELMESKTPPVGPGMWVSLHGQVPLAVTAGAWKTWYIDTDVATSDVPPPPTVGSAAMAEQVLITKRAAAARDSRWVAAINYWGGVPGSEAPAGIWQNHLWNRAGSTMAERDFAKAQSLLAKTIADTFVATWKVKYTYWTARPDMIDSAVSVAMANPPFPGYVSGHSAVSAAAATVLSALIPDFGYWMRSAEEARDSRLYAGIHLSVDNEQGFLLGETVGRQILKGLQLAPLTFTFNGGESQPPLLSAPVDGSAGVLSVASPSPAASDQTLVGTLYKISKPGLSRAFIVASDQKLPLGPGWTATSLSKNSAWVAGSCASSPSAMVGDRYVAYAEYPNLIVYDIVTKNFRRMALGSEGGFLLTVDERHVAILRNRMEGYGIAPLAMVVDVTDGSFVYRKIEGKEVLATETIRGSQVTIIGGKVAFTTEGTLLNGVRQQPEPNAAGETVFVDHDGQTAARIYGWRGATAWGWDAQHGYLAAVSAQNVGIYTIGAYDRLKTTWDWVFPSDALKDPLQAEVGGIWFVTLGTVAA